jgi:hypothetical protein
MDPMKLMEARMHQAEERIRQLEQHIHYPNQLITDKMTALKESATRVDTAPMRSDVETITTLREFVGRLVEGGDLYWSVSRAVNAAALRALGRLK